jgi:hypothetical protein
MNSLCRRYQLNKCQAPSGSSRKAALGFTLAADIAQRLMRGGELHQDTPLKLDSVAYVILAFGAFF